MLQRRVAQISRSADDRIVRSIRGPGRIDSGPPHFVGSSFASFHVVVLTPFRRLNGCLACLRVRHEAPLFSFCSRGPLFDLEAASSRDVLRRRRHGDLEYAVAELGVRLIGHRAFRQRDHAPGAAVAALGTIDAAAFLFLFATAFALNGDRTIGYIDLDVLLLEPRKFSPDDELVAALE